MISRSETEDSPYAMFCCVVVKASNSGLTSNSRLLVLQGHTLGYFSRTSLNCSSLSISQCKQKVSLRQEGVSFMIDKQHQNILVVAWKDVEGKHRMWEFKFEYAAIAQEWFQLMDGAVQLSTPYRQQDRPSTVPEASQQTDKTSQPLQSKQSEPLSSEVQHEPSEQESRHNGQRIRLNRQNIRDNLQPIRHKQQRNIHHQQRSRHKEQRIRHNSQSFPYQSVKKVVGKDKKSPLQKKQEKSPTMTRRNTTMSRFQYSENQGQGRIPLIQTFEEQSHGQPQMVPLSVHQLEEEEEEENWNSIWFRALDLSGPHARVRVVQQFSYFCQHICTQIAEEQLAESASKKWVPLKQEWNKQFFRSRETQFILLAPLSGKDKVLSVQNQRLYKSFDYELQCLQWFLKTTRNSMLVRVPLTCVVKVRGFIFLCQSLPPSQYERVLGEELAACGRRLNQVESRLGNRMEGVQLYREGPLHEDGRLLAMKIGQLLSFEQLQNSSYVFHLPAVISVAGPEGRAAQLNKLFDAFLLQQRKQSTILSCEDLLHKLFKFGLGREVLPLILKRLQERPNHYLKKLMLTQLVAQQFQFMVWLEGPTLMTAKLSELLHKGAVFTKIKEHLLDTLTINVNAQDIVPGYLLSSIATKTGLEVNYQVVMEQLQQGKKQIDCTLRTVNPVISAFKCQAVSQAYEELDHLRTQQPLCPQVFEEVINFYCLRQGVPPVHLGHYGCRRLFQYMSQFVPFEDQQQFEALHIYEQNEPGHLDYPTFKTIIAAVKWQLLEPQPNKALIIANQLQQDTWFWLGDHPLPLTQLYQILANHHETRGDLTEAISHHQKIVEVRKLMLGVSGSQDSSQRDWKLGQLYKLAGKHKQALERFKAVLGQLKQVHKSRVPSLLFEALMEASQLYLHLGSLPKCLSLAKEAIELSTLDPFPTQVLEFKAYQLLLRCCEIDPQQTNGKFGFYVGLLEDKFGNSPLRHIRQQVLRVVAMHTIQTLPKYSLKKLTYFMYSQERSRSSHIKQEQTLSPQYKPSQLREGLERCSEMLDGLLLDESSASNWADRFYQLLSFTGLQFVLGRVVEQLKSQQKTA